MRLGQWWVASGVLVVLGCGSAGPTTDAVAERGGHNVVDAAVDVKDGFAGLAPDAGQESGAGGHPAELGDGAADARDAAIDVAGASDAAGPGGEAGRDAGADGGGDATPWLPCRPGSLWFDFDYPVQAVAYSRVLDALVVLPSTERSVHIVDPESCSDKQVDLPRLGLSVSIAPSGLTAAVGEDGEVSVVDLPLGHLVASYPVSHPASEVAFDSKGRVQIYTRAVEGVSVPLLSLDSTTGVTTTAATGLDAGGHLRITPDGKALFWVFDGSSTADTFDRVDPDTGAPQALQNAAGAIHVCHDLFPTDDSAHLVTACGTVLDISSGTLSDSPTPHGALESVSLLQDLDSLVSKGVVVSIGKTDLFGSPNGPDVAGFIRVHAADTFNYVKQIDLPPLVVDNVMQTPIGRWVFIRSDGTRYYVVARRGGPEWGPLADGVARLDANATGQPVTTPIPAPSPPRYDVLPPPAEVPIAAVPLPFDVVDAAYSRSLDRLVVVSSSPTSAVLLVDPQTGAADTVATLASPSKVFVRADGVVAAVVRSGGVTFLDLQTGTVRREQETPSSEVAFGSDPQALVGQSGSSALTWIDFGAGTTRSAFSVPFGTVAFATVPGTQSFYTSVTGVASYPLSRHDDVATSADPSTDLSMFTPDNNVAPKCGGQFWTSDDGTRLILDCGRVYRLSPTPSQDLVYAGGLEATVAVTDVAYENTRDRFFLIPGMLFAGDTYFSQPPVITVHEGDALTMRALIDLQTAATAAGGPLSPRRVFVGPTPDRLYVLAAAGSFQPLGAAVLTLDVSNL